MDPQAAIAELERIKERDRRRAERYRTKQADRGKSHVTVWLTAEGLAAIDQYQRLNRMADRGEAVEAAAKTALSVLARYDRKSRQALVELSKESQELGMGD